MKITAGKFSLEIDDFLLLGLALLFAYCWAATR